MDNHKKVMLSLAMVAVIAVAAIGIGFAYQATTSNSGNSADVKYVVLKQQGEGSYQFTGGATQTVYWDSDDGKTTGVSPVYYTDYTLAEETQSVTIAGSAYTVVQIGKSFTLKAEPSAAGGATAALQCHTTITNGVVKEPTITQVHVGDVELFFVVKDSEAGNLTYYRAEGTNGFQKWDGDSWENDDFTLTISPDGTDAYFTKEISVYFGYLTTPGKIRITSENDTDSRLMTVTKPLDDVTFKFSVTVDEYNSILTGFTLSGEGTASVTVGNTTAVTVTAYTPANLNINDETLVVTSSDQTKATAEFSIIGDVPTITITGVAAGSATITVTSATNDSIHHDIVVTVS